MVDGDRFIENPVEVLKGIERFLQIPPFYTKRHFTNNGEHGEDRSSTECMCREERLSLLQAGPGHSGQLHGRGEGERPP